MLFGGCAKPNPPPPPNSTDRGVANYRLLPLTAAGPDNPAMAVLDRPPPPAPPERAPAPAEKLGLFTRLRIAFGRAWEIVRDVGAVLHPPRFSVFMVLAGDRKSTRLNSSHLGISYAVFCLKKKI